MDKLSRRERQVMDILYATPSLSASEILDAMDDAPSNSAVRALLRTMKDKELVVIRQDGPRYLYSPSVPRAEASASALQRLVHSFFDGSPARAAVALLEMSDDVDADELARLRELVAESDA